MDLLSCRQKILAYSKLKSQRRLGSETIKADAVARCDLAAVDKIVATASARLDTLENLELAGTEGGFDRPVSSLCFGKTLYAGDWAGSLYSIGSDAMQITAKTQCEGRIRGLAYSDGRGLACGSGSSIKLCTEDLQIKAALNCESEVYKIDWHPCNFIAGGYHDETWKLWDVESQTILLSQAGHSKPVYNVKIHPDGSLLASAGLDGYVYIWDLRTGKPVQECEHLREVYSLAWNPNGYVLASGAADNTVCLWDLRKRIKKVIPAHTSVVSDLIYVDSVLVSGSYDKSIRLWVDDNLVKTYQSSDKVMSLAYRNEVLACGKWDRTVDFFKHSARAQ